MTGTDADIIIVGAGPAGLMLAGAAAPALREALGYWFGPSRTA